MFPDFYQGAQMYFDSLSKESLLSLKNELKEFIEKNDHASPKKMKMEWLKLGAEAWQSDLVIHSVIGDFLFLIDEKL